LPPLPGQLPFVLTITARNRDQNGRQRRAPLPKARGARLLTTFLLVTRSCRIVAIDGAAGKVWLRLRRRGDQCGHRDR